MTTRAEAIERALKPFADTVFNDNGDVTIDRSDIRTEHYMVAKAALSLPPDPEPGAGVELETTKEERAEAYERLGDLPPVTLAAELTPRLLRDIAKLQAEIASWKQQSDDWQKVGWQNGERADAFESEIARLRPLADEARTMRAALKDVRGWIEPLVKTHTAVAEAVRRIDRALAPAPSPETRDG